MAYRNIFITKPAFISSKLEQLIIKIDETSNQIPIEDISTVMVENQGVCITAYALAKLSEAGACVFFCDEKHLPCAVMHPLNTHSRQLKMLKAQIDRPKPFHKKLWRQIIQAKISNQAKCLKVLWKDESEKLVEMSKNISSGDKGHLEGAAAAIYFRSLFGKNFSRENDNLINACLNYGYAIIRGVIARTLVCYGFETSLAIFHHSELNNFNLADDLIEPYRPIVDLFTAQNIMDKDGDLTPALKQQLFGLLSMSVMQSGEKHSITYAVERTVKSLSSLYLEKKDTLLLPELIPLKIHEYE